MEQFLRDNPIFRHEHLEAHADALITPLSSRATKTLLARWRKTGRLLDVRKGLYLSVEAELPQEPALAVLAAGMSRSDGVVAYQAALMHHLGLAQPHRLPIIADTQAMVTLQVMDFLEGWLVEHIQGEDCQLSAYLRGK